MKRSFNLLIPMIAAVAATTAASAQESIIPSVSYTYLDKLISVAQKNYPEVQLRSAQTAIAKNNITKVNVGYLDALSFSYYYRPNYAVDIVNPNLFNGYQLGVNLNIGLLLQKPFLTKEAKGQYKVAQLTEKSYDLSLTEKVKERYFTYLEQIAQLKLRTRSYTDADALVKQLRFKFEKGEATLDDYQRSILNSTEQNQSLIRAESGILIAKASLEELLGERLENIK